MFRDETNDQRDSVEDLVRAGAQCPEPSRGLRERIIAEAASAQAASVRRARRGRAGITLAVALVAVTSAVSGPPVTAVPLQAAMVPLVLQRVERTLVEQPAVSLSAIESGPARSDWLQVESRSHVRRWQMRTLRSAFGS